LGTNSGIISWIPLKPKENQLRLFIFHLQLRSPFVKAPQAAISKQLFVPATHQTITAKREVLGGYSKETVGRGFQRRKTNGY